jgi:hypothetical protein
MATGAIACAPFPNAETPSSPGEGEVVEPVVNGPTDDWGEAPVDEALTPEVRDRILQTVATDVNRPVADLRIAAAETATFDGCMGIYVPDQMCTMIAIFGFRVVVTDGDQSWVYHTRQDGEEAVQNPTASGSRNGLIPDFIPQPATAPEPEPEPHRFRAVESGGLAGHVQETMLLNDGRLVRRENGTIIGEHQLSREHLEEFDQVLEDQRFPNLNRMRYVTEAAFADYPTVQLSSGHLKTEYIDLAMDDLPPALQTVIQAWDDLVAQAGLD